MVLLGALLLFAPVRLFLAQLMLFFEIIVTSPFSLSCRGDVHAPCIPLCNGMCRTQELCRQSDNTGVWGPLGSGEYHLYKVWKMVPVDAVVVLLK